jgi:predicted RecB family nuclease
MDEILAYNQEDLSATWMVMEWLETLRSDGVATTA